MRVLPYFLLTFLFLALSSTPALAGELVEGRGYRIELPAGFSESSSLEDAGRRHLRSRLTHLAIDGTPDVRAYVHGDEEHPNATIFFCRVNVENAVSNLETLGLDHMDTLREKLPVGFDFQPREVDGRAGIEMKFSAAVLDNGHTARFITVACDDYVVVVILDTENGSFPDAQPTWDRMAATLKIIPTMSRLLLALLFAAGGAGVLFLLGRLSASSRRIKVPTPTQHLVGLDREGSARGSSGAKASSSGSGPRDRPARKTPPAPKGLRNTGSKSGKWEN